MTSRLRRMAVPLFAVAMTVAACGPAAATLSTTAASSSAPTPPTDLPTASPAAETPIVVTPGPTAEPQAGQTETEWGRIWDSIPPDFPEYPGSTVSAEAATGPVSATLVVADTDIEAIATWWQDALEVAAFSTEAMSGPLEDGSFVIDSIGQDAECRSMVSIAPLGGMTSITIWYGAGCPLA